MRVILDHINPDHPKNRSLSTKNTKDTKDTKQISMLC